MASATKRCVGGPSLSLLGQQCCCHLGEGPLMQCIVASAVLIAPPSSGYATVYFNTLLLTAEP